MNFENWYKTISESNAVIAPERVWNSIKNNLDVDLVWDRVSNKLASSRKKKLFVTFAMAATFLLIISTAVLLYFFSTERMEQNQIVLNRDLFESESVEVTQVNHAQEPIQKIVSEITTITVKISDKESEMKSNYFNSNPTDHQQESLENFAVKPVVSIQAFKFQVNKQIDKFYLNLKTR
jgi:hypothetical protein